MIAAFAGGGDFDVLAALDDPAVEGVDFYSAAADHVLQQRGAAGAEGLGAGDQLGVELCGIAAVGDIDEALRIDLDVTPVSWAFMWRYNGFLSRGQILRSMEDLLTRCCRSSAGWGAGRRQGSSQPGPSPSALRHEFGAEEQDFDTVNL